MSVLNRIDSSADIKALSEEELKTLADEMRVFLVESVSKTGGHLASNLGAVELTLALHRVYDTAVDRIVFDVGHQSYVHKIITGRRDRFGTLRQYGGISGFPKPREADDDAFIAGHASNSVSVAVGMAKARTLCGEHYDVACVLGDGALTGGLAYEGLAAAAASGEPMVIILNDNNMSIDPNVGGTAHLLQSMRIRPGYIRFKRLYRDAVSRTPGIYAFSHEVKEFLKERLLPVNMFSAMGLNYLGPVDGHSLKDLESVLRLARDMEEPVLVHVLTKKGKGCAFAEEHPEIYHGVGPFDPNTGEIKDTGRSFSDCFGETLCGIAGQNPRVVAVTAAMTLGTGLEGFAKRYPDRFQDVGIAEGHATAMSAGMAKQGMIPVFGIFDVSYLRTVPGMKILCPASFGELSAMLRTAVTDMTGPVALRYPRGGECGYHDVHVEREYLLRSGENITLVAYGTMVGEMLKAAEELERKNIRADVVKLSEIDGEVFPLVRQSIEKTGRMIIAEEVCSAGSIGTVLTAQAARAGIPVRTALLNLGDGLVPHGSREQLMRDFQIDAQTVVQEAVRLCAKT